MIRPASIAALLALSVTAAPLAQARSSGHQSLHLRVGPGVNATISTATMHISCSDDADCQVDLPAGSTFDVVARAAGRRNFRWSGCSSEPEPDRCRVEMRGEPRLVTVR